MIRWFVRVLFFWRRKQAPVRKAPLPGSAENLQSLIATPWTPDLQDAIREAIREGVKTSIEEVSVLLSDSLEKAHRESAEGNRELLREILREVLDRLPKSGSGEDPGRDFPGFLDSLPLREEIRAGFDSLGEKLSRSLDESLGKHLGAFTASLVEIGRDFDGLMEEAVRHREEGIPPMLPDQAAPPPEAPPAEVPQVEEPAPVVPPVPSPPERPPGNPGPPTKLRTCKQCHQVKSLSEFGADGRTKDGFAVSCKPCRKQIGERSAGKRWERKQAKGGKAGREGSPSSPPGSPPTETPFQQKVRGLDIWDAGKPINRTGRN